MRKAYNSMHAGFLTLKQETSLFNFKDTFYNNTIKIKF